MPKAIIVEDRQLEHAIKVAAVTGRNRLCDVALLYILFGTALTPGEIALIRVSDYLTESGECRRDWKVRTEISYNGHARPLFFVNPKLIRALDAYLDERARQGLGVSSRTKAYRGLDHESCLFLTEDGRSFAMTTRVIDGKAYKAADHLKATGNNEQTMI